VIEIELAEIEDRMAAYPPDAQADIRWLTRELRKLYNLGTRNAEPPSSAIYDSVTGLLSGGAYGVRFAAARARAGRNKKLFAVMSIVLPVSQSVAAGTVAEREVEEVLKHVAERLVQCAREVDTFARVDDEKFAMILEDMAMPEHAERVKQKVEAALAEPIELGARAVRVAASVSLQFYPAPRVDRKLN
jgi:GGDEF domain-containing protein